MTYPDIFESPTFFFPDRKIAPSTRSVFQSNSTVHTHPMVSGFTLKKLGLLAILVYYLVRDWTRFCCVIGFENIRIHRPHVIGFVADLFFSTLDCCRIRRMRVDGSRIRKEKLADSKISRYVWTGSWVTRVEAIIRQVLIAMKKYTFCFYIHVQNVYLYILTCFQIINLQITTIITINILYI